MNTPEVTRRVAIALLFSVQLFSARGVTFTTDTIIGVNDFSEESRDVIVTNCTLTVDGAHQFNSLQIQNGGVVTHSPYTNGPVELLFTVTTEAPYLSATNPATLNNTNVDPATIQVMDLSHSITYTQDVDYLITTQALFTQITLTKNSAIAEGAEAFVDYTWTQSYQGFELSIRHNLLIAEGGAINVSGKGYSGGNGFSTGAGGSQSTNYPFTFTAGSGGAHGGSGGMSSTLAAGGAAYDSTAIPAGLGSGGGSGTTNGTGIIYGGAGGGLVYLDVGGVLQVDGQILADGLTGTNSHSGGGAGGSVFLLAPIIFGTGTISANGGAGEVPDGGGGGGGRISFNSITNTFTGTNRAFGGAGATSGGAGTVYIASLIDGPPRLFMINGGKRGTDTLFSATSIANLTISGGAVARPQLGNVSIKNLFLGSNSCLIPPNASSLVLKVSGDAIVESNAVLNVDAQSLFGTGAGQSGQSPCQAGSGGGYGGAGGASACGTPGGTTYGSFLSPGQPGSPAGPLSVTRGGGSLQMTVVGTLSLWGNISANGAPTATSLSGGGSGGGVWLTVGTLLGGGNISANGGAASNSVSGGGGGGRIAIYFETNLFIGHLTARGGAATNPGGPGTVYLSDTNSAFAQLTLDNGGLAGLSSLPASVLWADLTITGGAIVTNNTVTAVLRNLFIGSNSWFFSQPAANPTLVITATNVTIQPGGGIKLSGAYSGGGSQGQTLNFTGGGGGNAGIGGASAIGAGGGFFSGQVDAPTSYGGGGGGGLTGLGGRGGGFVKLTVASELRIDGSILSEGLPGSVFNSGGGAGGSIDFTAQTFSGAGAVSANGGAGNNSMGGGGSGGRVAVHFKTNGFSGDIVARGGAGANYGAAGTVYLAQDKSIGIFIDNGGVRGAVTQSPTISDRFDLALTGGAALTNVTSTVSVNNFLIGSNSVFMTFGTAPSTLTIYSNATIQAGGILSCDGVNSSGNSQGQSVNATGGGGSYGGVGGVSLSGAAGGFPLFDLINAPITLGSRGGSGASGNGGFGGGSVHLICNGKLQLDGRISAEGSSGPGLNSGGGSGGALWLVVSNLSGSGLISVNGGAANAGGGGGGGGRIAIFCTTNTFTGKLTAYGGTGVNFGGAGTIYVNPNDSVQKLPSQLIVDNGGAPGNTLISQYPSGNFNLTVAGRATLENTNSPGTLTFQNLLVSSNSTFVTYPQGSQMIVVLTNATIQASGRLMADGLSSSTVSAGQSVNATGGGGGHGGYGGESRSNAPGGNITPDLLFTPSSPGSRGGSATGNNLGGNGGGAVRLTVNGTLQVDGKLSADGLGASGFNAGGGSGGALWISAAKLLGSGAISANGGPGNNAGGGGGGGRIAIGYGTNLFSGTLAARGGAGANYGGAGTIIYSTLSASGSIPALLTVDNGGVRGTNTLLTAPPNEIDVVVGSGATMNLPPGAVIWKNLTIATNATLGLSTNGSFGILALTITSNLTVQSGGSIALDGAGFAAGTGPGFGYFATFNSGSGGGHGGYGSAALLAAGGTVYDSILVPALPGSGGGVTYVATGSAGGGVIQLAVKRTLQVDGSITANGTAGGGPAQGGGAGGSIYLSVETLSGAGKISTDGGDGDPFNSGGGGGGRIAAYFQTNAFTGTFSAHGGAGVGLSGGAGTIYTRENRANFAELRLDNSGAAGTNTPLDSLVQPVALSIKSGAAANSKVPLTLQSLSIGPGGLFDANPLTALNLTVIGDAVVQPGGAITVDAGGYGSTNGAGAGTVDFFGDGSGGGYGGAGGASFFGMAGGGIYGSSNQPVDFGSAGGVTPALTNFSQGGGVIRLKVNGSLALNGVISANGNDGIIDGSGGGSGGSIWITALSLSGSGMLSANGGAGESIEGGGGGGGRIAIYTSANLFSGSSSAAGGAGASPGQAGTFFVFTNLLVSGNILDTNGTGVTGITLQPSGLTPVITDASGSYSVPVPLMWNGSITASGSSLIIPGLRTYSNLASNAANQNFLVATTADFNFNGSQPNGTNINFNWYGINGVIYQPLYSTNLVNWLPYGPPLTGGQAPLTIAFPITNAPQLFFRLGVSY